MIVLDTVNPFACESSETVGALVSTVKLLINKELLSFPAGSVTRIEQFECTPSDILLNFSVF